jgi:4-amino-4-deoxy-L-arabinose transferase-like glycosyltransferase
MRNIRCHLLSISKPTHLTSAALIGILALTFYLRLLFFGEYIDADVGNLGYMAWRMAEGEVLIDLEGPGKPPLYIMLYAIFIRLFGTSLIGLKLFGAVFILMAVMAVYWLGKQAYGKGAGLLAALLFGVFSSTPMVEGETVNLETLMHLPYILAISFFLKALTSGQRQWYLLTGMCAAMATLVKQVAGVVFFVFLCYGIQEWWRKKGHFSKRQWLYSYLVLGVGALLPVIGLIIFYQAHGYSLNELYDSMLSNNFLYIQRGHEGANILKNFFLAMKIILPENSLLWLGTIFGSAYLGWRIRRGQEEMSDRIMLWWAFWSFAVLWISGTFFWHYFLQLIAPFSVLTACGIVNIWRLTKSLSSSFRVLARGVWTMLLLIMVILFIKTDYKYFFSYKPVEQTVLLFEGYGIYNVAMHEIASYIRSRTDPHETIYVWGIAPHIYFLAQRKAATRYRNNYNMSLSFTGKPKNALQAYAQTAMEEIWKSRPAYIVQIFRLEHFPELQAFIQEQYTVDTDAEFSVPRYKFALYKRKPEVQVIPSPK